MSDASASPPPESSFAFDFNRRSGAAGVVTLSAAPRAPIRSTSLARALARLRGIVSSRRIVQRGGGSSGSAASCCFAGASVQPSFSRSPSSATGSPVEYAPLASLCIVVHLARADKGSPDAALAFQRQVVAPCLRAGLRVRAFHGAVEDGGSRSAGPSRVFLEVSASLARLLAEAERSRLSLALDAAALAAADVRENQRLVDEDGMSFDVRGADSEHMDLHIPPLPPGCCAGCCLYASVSGFELDPYARIFSRYVSGARLAPLYAVQRSTNGPLTEAQALRLLLGIVEAGAYVEGGAGLDLDDLAHSRVLIRSWFVAHTRAGRERLRAAWPACAPPWRVPVEALRDYLGERVAFFFLFLSFLCRWMLLPAVGGVAIFVHQLVVVNPNTVYLPVYGVLVAVWSTFFIAFWRREQARAAQKWGTRNFRRQEALRPEYAHSARRVRSPVDGKPTYASSPTGYALRRSAAAALTSLLLGVVIVACASIFILRVVLVSVTER